MVERYNLYTFAQRLHLSGCHNGLIFPVCTFMGGIKYDRCQFLFGGIRKSPSGRPEIFNTDQGSQFTSHAFTCCLSDKAVKISMDGKGRAIDNIFIERLWRSVKYEQVYLHDYETVLDAVKGIGSYFGFYNHERFHQSLNYETPAAWYFGKTI